MFLIYALKDDGNIGAGNLTPLGLFFIIFGIGGKIGLMQKVQAHYFVNC